MPTTLINWLKHHSHLNWTFADQMMVSAVNFFTNILIARFLGLEDFGRFGLLWMLILFLNSLQIAMIISPMQSIGSQQSDKAAPSYYGAVLAQQLIAGTLSFLFIYLFISASGNFFPRWQINEFALPLAAVAFAFQFQDFLRRYLIVRGKMFWMFVNDIISYGGQLIGLLCLSQTDFFSITTVLWTISLTSSVAIGVGLLTLGTVVWQLSVFRQVTVRHWHFAKWLLNSALLERLKDSLINLIIATVLSVAAVGALKACQNIIGVTHVLLLALQNIVPVKAGQYYREGGNRLLSAYLGKVALFGGGLMIGIALILGGLPTLWVELFYGDEFITYSYLLSWLAIIYVVSFFNLPLRTGLRVMEFTRPIFTSLFWTSLLEILSIYLLAVYFGLHGVMLGGLLAAIMQFALLLLIYKSLMDSKHAKTT